MSVNLLSPTPASLAFARNPVIFKLKSNNVDFSLYAAVGATATLEAGSSDKFDTGETLTVTYEEADGTTESVVFSAAGTYAAENEIPDDTFSGSASLYWSEVLLKVKSHHRIAPYFNVIRTGPIGGNTLIFTALDSDPGFTVTLANTAGFTVSSTVAVADTTPDNYAVVLEVYVESAYKGGNYALAAKLENTPDTSGLLYFDISSILEAECRASLVEPVVPVWDTTDTAPADNLRRYYIRFTERYGSPAVAQEWEYDEVRTIMNGGVSQSVFSEGDFLAGLNVNDSLLTWMPDGRKIGLNQPEFLGWYNWDVELRSVRIEMQWYDVTDNTRSASAGFLTYIDVDPGGVALFPVNPTLMGLDSEDNAYKYRVRVAYLDDSLVFQPMSQWRTYYIDRDYYQSERYVQYLNGFGLPECWRCTGEWGKRLTVSRSVGQTPLLPAYNEFATDQFQYSREWEHELTYRTGYLRLGEADVLQEMLISDAVYDVSSEGYIPLLVTTNAFTVTNTNEQLHAYQFNSRPRLNMRNYSKRKLSAILSASWQEPGGDSWFDAFLIPWGLPT